MPQALLLVLTGRPGTGKTTLARLLSAELAAVYLRADAMVMPLMHAGLTDDTAEATRAAYDVAHEVAAENLQGGTAVVFDGLNATHEQRTGWVELARREGVDLLFIETTINDPREHQRRVDQRGQASEGYLGPSWDSIEKHARDPWEDRDGPRFVVEMTDSRAALSLVMSQIRALQA